MSKKTDKPAPAQIAQNRKAWHDYFIEQKFGPAWRCTAGK